MFVWEANENTCKVWWLVIMQLTGLIVTFVGSKLYYLAVCLFFWDIQDSNISPLLP